MSWQKPARIAVAIVGLASAGAVYFMMGERRVSQAPPPVQTRDPDAIVEMSGSTLKNFPWNTKDFEVDADLWGFYEDGSKKLTGNVRILVHKGENRTFRVAGEELKLSKDDNYFEVTGGPVRLEESDGFWLETDRATVSRLDSISHVPGAATFGKGRMTGSGVGFSYDNAREILLISQQARVKTVDEKGKVVTQLASETAMLDRLQHVLTMDTGVHVVRDDQVIDTDRGNARLSADNDIVTAMELFGNSKVTGGPSIDAMRARDITLDYTDDGKTLEAARLVGGADITTKGRDGKSGQRISGEEKVELTLAADGALTRAEARVNVRLELPAGGDTPSRSITAQALDGAGEAGKGLTSLIFVNDVAFSEQPLRAPGSTAGNPGVRTARSQRLEASLADDAVTSAAFSGGVTFEEAGLKACAAQADYRPQKGTLALAGASTSGPPMVAEEDVAIEAESIDVSLDTRRMSARRDVKTFMRSPAVQRCRPSTARPAADRGATQVPRLLKSDTPTTVVASGLEYDSEKGYAEYSGRTTLTQEATAISGDKLVIDQTKGDLTATGNAVSTLILDNENTAGRAHEIRYVDAKRLLTYSTAPKTAGGEVWLRSGADSDVRAGNIAITLDAKENKPEAMKALRNVRVTEDAHTVTGGATLDYTASDGQFVVRSDGRKPVVAVTRRGGTCQQSSGDSITFYKEKDTVIVDGNQKSEAFTAPSKGSCTPSAR